MQNDGRPNNPLTNKTMHSHIGSLTIIVSCLLSPYGVSQVQPGLYLPMDNQESIQQSGFTTDGFSWLQPGVKGQAMGFDGIQTVVTLPSAKSPDLSDGFTVSAWLAMEAYPWTQLAIIDHELKQQSGYYLGIHPEGYAELGMAAGDQWQVARSQKKLSLYSWNHLAGTWSPDDGLHLYINGREVAAVKTSDRFTPAKELDVLIGRNHTPRMLHEAIRDPVPIKFSLQGLIDEVRISPGALSAPAIAAMHTAQRPSGPRPLNPPRLPAGPDGPGEFGASYTRLQYTKAWEHHWRVGDHPDVLVRFDQAPYRFVFWRGTSFIPCWVTGNGVWYTNEFFETGEIPKQKSAEPMSDKQTRNSQVRIIENNAARVVVHWRYSPLYPDYSHAHVNPETGWNDWVDEYYTIYPDGVGVRKIRVFSTHPFPVPGKEPGMGGFREYHESIIINPPGTAPHDNIQTKGLTLANMDGQTITYSWENGPPKIDISKNKKLTIPEYLRKERPSHPWRAYLTDIPAPNIHRVNLKAKHSPFVIVHPKDVMIDCYVREVKLDRSIFPWWNHWPVTQIESNGRWAYTKDRPSHSSLTHIYWPPHQQDHQSLTKIMLHGMTDRPAKELVPLAKSWINPAPLSILDGAASPAHYDPTERAYLLTMDQPGSKKPLRLRLNSSPAHPAVNPAIIMSGCGDRPVTVSLNGRIGTQNIDYRAGFRKTLNGTDLVLWINQSTTKPLNITVQTTHP